MHVLQVFTKIRFRNQVFLGDRAGAMILSAGLVRKICDREILTSMSVDACVYLCGFLRALANNVAARGEILTSMILGSMRDAWEEQRKQAQLEPHLSLLLSCFAYHEDAHTELIMQGGIQTACQLYQQSEDEHVRLCCLLVLLYMSCSEEAQRAVNNECGIQLLLAACENEGQLDLIQTALKSLLPFTQSDSYRAQIGMLGGIDTVSAFIFSDNLNMQQLGILLLQNLLEFRTNRQIFLKIHPEKTTEEDYFKALVDILPRQMRGAPEKLRLNQADRELVKFDKPPLTKHDPFVVRCAVHCMALLSLEQSEAAYTRMMTFNVPRLLFNLLYSEQIDRSAGEAVVLYFAEVLHGPQHVQKELMENLDC